MPPFANHKKPISQTVSDSSFRLPCLPFIHIRLFSVLFSLYFPIIFPFSGYICPSGPNFKVSSSGQRSVTISFFKFFWFVFWNQLQRQVKKKTDGQRPGVVS
ncbi:hypothetical protein F5Y01DRAFT_90181 [Xylaria sp. FL0043]|nr:hypothetical protein F5Y01DRAFT_90181 [Xylaria sp. FL0043]